MFCFPISDHVIELQRTVSFKCRPMHGHVCILMKFPGELHVVCIGKAKNTNLKGLTLVGLQYFHASQLSEVLFNLVPTVLSLPFPREKIACSRCSDRGDSAKRCEQKKITMWGAGSFTAYIFLSLSFSTIRTPGTKTHLSEIGKVGTIYSYFEKGCREKCTRQS